MWARHLIECVEDRLGHAHPGDAPAADQALAPQPLESRDDGVAIKRPSGGDLGAALVFDRIDEVVGTDLVVEEEEVDPFEPHRLEARFEGSAEPRINLGVWDSTDAALVLTFTPRGTRPSKASPISASQIL